MSRAATALGYQFDAPAFGKARARAIEFARIILAGASQRPGNFSCFGLHEWAMAYKSEENGIRHEYLPLRLGAQGTDEVSGKPTEIRCTHFDAFRFYTPQAVSLNELQPTRETQRDLEQPGCLHANMDLYKWAYKLAGAVPSELVMDCFELAWDIRTMDMQASPYDLGDWGHEPIRIETPRSKAEYVAVAKNLRSAPMPLRKRLLDVANNLPISGRLELLVGAGASWMHGRSTHGNHLPAGRHRGQRRGPLAGFLRRRQRP